MNMGQREELAIAAKEGKCRLAHSRHSVELDVVRYAQYGAVSLPVGPGVDGLGVVKIHGERIRRPRKPWSGQIEIRNSQRGDDAIPQLMKPVGRQVEGTGQVGCPFQDHEALETLARAFAQTDATRLAQIRFKELYVGF